MKMLNQFPRKNTNISSFTLNGNNFFDFKKIISFISILVAGMTMSFGQLSVGDIAFVQYNADGTDDFAFVCLVDIPASEVVKFTDNEENTLTGGEGTITWTAPVGGVSCGTIVTITTTPSATIGTVTETNDVNFAGGGDGIIAYQGTTGSPTFITALGNDGATGGVYSGANEGSLPAGLTLGTNAQSIVEIDNANYNGATLSGTKATILSAIYDFSNWSGSNTVNQAFSGTFSVTSCSATPTITTSVSSLSAFTYIEGSGPSTEQSFTVEGTNLTGDITITPPTAWEISTGTGGLFSPTNPITLSPSSGTVSPTIIYTRMKSGLLNANSPFADVIACTSPSSTTIDVNVDGTVTLACATPTNQATALVFSNITSTAIDVAWTASIPASDNYLVVQSTSSTMSSNPVDANTYAVTDPLGGGTVVFNGSGVSFTDSGLSSNTTYYYFVFAYNDTGCSGGPMYLTPALTDNETTSTAPDVVITEFAGSGLGGNFNDEYFELVNFDATSVNLSGWTLEYYNNTSLERTENLSGTIAANSAFVIAVRTTYTGALSPDYIPASSFSLNSTGYVILKQAGTIIDQAGSSGNKFSNNKNYEFTDCPNDNLPTANWNDLGTGNGTPGVVNCDCTPPASQATVATFSNINPTTLDLSWTAGSGTNSLVVIKEGGAVVATPSSGTSYTANTVFGSGQDIGTNEYVLYNGAGTSMTITGLSQGLTYHVVVYTFNSADDCYNMTSPAVANETTSCGPTPDDVTSFIATCANGETTLTWNNPAVCFDNVLIFASESTCTSNTPTGNGGAYSPADPIYGMGDDDLETGVAYLVYKGTGTSVTVTGLTNGQDYCFKIFSREASTWSTGVEVSCTPSLTYCSAASTNSGFEYIQGVEINTINNTSAATTYTDYTAISTTLERGETYPITVYVGDFYTTDSCLVWIDWDYNGTFDPITELVYEGYGTAPFTGNITVPVGASLVTTRMRIRLYDSNASYVTNDIPCGTHEYGEVEDYSLIIVEPCTPVHTVSSYLPTEGPELTEVTITGTGFTVGTTVDFGGASAAVTFIDATTIIAEVPVGALTGEINVIETSCDIQAGSYTVTVINETCAGTSSFTDIILSEVYDSDGGNVAYIELYNPLTTDIDLNAGGTDYTIKIDNIPGAGINRTIDLIGSILAGETFLINLGTSAGPCGLTFDMTSGGSGFNSDDYIYLAKNGTDVDRVNLPNQIGFSVSRDGAASGPTTTYNSADWTVLLTEDCSGLGNAPVSAATSPSLSAVVDQGICASNFSVTATAGASGSFTYIWYFNDGTAGWSVVNATNLPNITLSGETTSSLTLTAGTDEISTIDGYQFYVEVTEDANCVSNSNAAQYTDPENCIPCIQLFISEYGEPSAGEGKYLEIYNPTSNNVDLSNYQVWMITNDGTWAEETVGLSGTLAPFEVYLLANNTTDVTTADQYHYNTMNFNGNDAVGLAYNGGSGSTFTLIDAVGEETVSAVSGWDVAGTTDATQDHTLRRKSSIQAPNTNWTTSAGTNTTDSEWEVLTYTQTSLNEHTGDCGTNSEAIVSFDTPPNATNDETDGTITIPVTIFNPDATATSVDVVLISGDATMINNYTTQSVTFPGGSGTNETISVTITDDAICTGNQEYVFELQNVSGGSGAIIGANTTFTLTVIDDEMGSDVYLEDNFDDADITDWTQATAGEWGSYNGTQNTPFAAVLNGSNSMRQYTDEAPANLQSSIYHEYNDCFSILDIQTTWRFQVYTNVNPSLNEYFLIYLNNSSATTDQTHGTGYALGVYPQMAGDHDFIEFFKINNGVVSSSLINSGMAWQTTSHNDPAIPNHKIGVEITRDETGLWSLKLDINGGFDNLVTYGTPVTNTDYDSTGKFEIYRKHNVSTDDSFMIDDVKISQSICESVYYSQGSGDMSDAIWDDVMSGTGQTLNSNKFTRLVIQNGHSVVLDENLVCNGLGVDAGGSFDAADKYLCVRGPVHFDGTFIEGTSYVDLVGDNVAQTIANTTPSTFYDLGIDNSAGVNSLSGFDIKNAVYPKSGTFNISGGMLTLKSDATGTASIAEIMPAADVTGNVRLERYIQADSSDPNSGYPGGWVGIATAIQGRTIADWNADLITTGFPGSDYPNYAYPNGVLFNNIIKWDGATGTWDKADALTDVISGDGFFVYMQQYVQNTHMQDAFLKGNQTESLTTTFGGWNLIVNPYPCAVSWDQVHAASTGVDPSYYIYNSDAAVYISYNAADSSGLASNKIAASQSLWVKATSGPASISWQESQKRVDGTDIWERTDGVGNGFGIILKQDNQTKDHCFVGFNDDATGDYESNHDTEKFNIPMPESTGAYVSTLSNDEVSLLQNIYSEVGYELSIPVYIESYALDQTYALTFKGLQNVDQYCMILEDLVLGTYSIIDEYFEYDFTVLEDEGVRFVVHMYDNQEECNDSQVTAIDEFNESNTSVRITENQLLISTLNSYSNINIELYNALGQLIVSSQVNLTNGTGILPLKTLERGMYLIHISNDSNMIYSTKMMR